MTRPISRNDTAATTLPERRNDTAGTPQRHRRNATTADPKRHNGKPSTMLTFNVQCFVTLIQSASTQPRSTFGSGSAATKPNFAPIHLPWRISKGSPQGVNFLPSVL